MIRLARSEPGPHGLVADAPLGEQRSVVLNPLPEPGNPVRVVHLEVSDRLDDGRGTGGTRRSPPGEGGARPGAGGRARLGTALRSRGQPRRSRAVRRGQPALPWRPEWRGSAPGQPPPAPGEPCAAWKSSGSCSPNATRTRLRKDFRASNESPTGISASGGREPGSAVARTAS